MKKVFLSLIKLPQFITLPLFLCLLLTLRLLLDLYLEISYSINEIVFKYGLTIATGEIMYYNSFKIILPPFQNTSRHGRRLVWR